MIVVDTNVVAYLYLPSDYTAQSERLLSRDPDWAAPALWCSEMRNVLALYLRKGILAFDQAYAIQREAESLLAAHEYEMDSLEVLQLAKTSDCSAYDCEFVALARYLDVPLVTADKQILDGFPSVAVPLT